MEIKNKREDLFTQNLPPVIGEGGSDGITYDVLWEGNVIPDGQTQLINLTHDISDYKFIIACQVGGTMIGPAASILPVDFMQRQNFYPIYLYNYGSGALTLDKFLFAEYKAADTNYAIFKAEGENAIYNVKIMGIK